MCDNWCGYPKWLQHPEEGHWEDEQVYRSPDKVPENMGQESRGNTSHHRYYWNSWQEHQASITSTTCKDQQSLE